MTKKKRGCLRIVLRTAIVFVVLVLVLVWAAVNFRPTVRDGTPLIVVSEETTGIVSPLDVNGDVDYFEALDLVMSDGVRRRIGRFATKSINSKLPTSIGARAFSQRSGDAEPRGGWWARYWSECSCQTPLPSTALSFVLEFFSI